MVQFYNKGKGRNNYKETKIIESIISSCKDKGIDLNDIGVANNFDELKRLHDKYVVETIDFEELPKSESTNSSDDFNVSEEHSEKQPFIDPMNRDSPMVREYVLEGSGNDREGSNQTFFSEPTTFDESFEMPDDSFNDNSDKKNTSERGGKGSRQEKQEPLNPQFDEMSSSRKRKSTKKMAAAIVEGVCKLSEMGCIWWATKDTTEDKLLEYEINGDIDLKILLTLDNDTEITVKEWFQQQNIIANEVLKVDDDNKKDIADALYEVLLEKGIAPSPMQELAMTVISSIVINLGAKSYMLQKQTENVLSQLRKQAVSNSKENDIAQERVFDSEDKSIINKDLDNAESIESITDIIESK